MIGSIDSENPPIELTIFGVFVAVVIVTWRSPHIQNELLGESDFSSPSPYHFVEDKKKILFVDQSRLIELGGDSYIKLDKIGQARKKRIRKDSLKTWPLEVSRIKGSSYQLYLKRVLELKIFEHCICSMKGFWCTCRFFELFKRDKK